MSVFIFAFGISIGIVLGIYIKPLYKIISKYKNQVVFSLTHQQYLKKHICKIFHSYGLTIEEMDVILCVKFPHNNDKFWHDRIAYAANEIANLLCREDLTMEQGNKLFESCYDFIHLGLKEG